MLKVDYETIVGAKGSFEFKTAAQVDLWLSSRSQPSGYRFVVSDDKGDLVGTKAFGVTEIEWTEQQKTILSKSRRLIGCKPTMVSLDAATIARARDIGDGNISLGLRKAVAAMSFDPSPVTSTSSMTEEINRKLDKMFGQGSVFEIQLPRGENRSIFIAEVKREAGKRGFEVRVEEIRAIKNRFLICQD